MITKRRGFTIVEITIVVAIIAILTSIGTPAYLRYTLRARAAEAVAVLGLMRQVERECFARHNSYLNVSSGDLSNDTEATSSPGLGINVGTAQYFSQVSYSVIAGATSARFSAPAAVDFIIYTDGDDSVLCAGSLTDCAIKADAVEDYLLEMDNTGRIFVSYNNGADWVAW